ncbi:MAG: MFS transporter [Planctomycetota bacterium]|nr:MFS transporter [Planctomycetota bacterium]
MRRYLPLVCLALLHTIVDTSALLVSPLWDRITVECRLAGLSLVGVMLAHSMPTSLAQGVFGFLRERKRLRWLMFAGPVAAVVCLTSVGGVAAAGRVGWLCALFVVGGVSVGAFHPEAAVRAGTLLPENRTRGLSIFMLGGSLGLSLGPLLSGYVVQRWDLEGLLYLMPGLLVLIPVLYWGTTRGETVADPPDGSRKAEKPRRLSEMFDGRVGLALALLLVCSCRLVPNMGMSKVMSFTLADRGFDERTVGLVQSLFLVSASVGMTLMAVLFPAGWERRFMVACPLLGLPLLAVWGWSDCPTWLLIGVLVPTGLVLWGTTPTMVSYAQQLFPRGAGVASAMTMGLAWGVGGLIEAPFTTYFQDIDRPQLAVWAFLPFLFVASVGAMFLPKAGVESDLKKPEMGS